MLVLTRRKNQRVKIGELGWVTVVEVRGDKVRLGFDISLDIVIHREEVAKAIELGRMLPPINQDHDEGGEL